MAATLGELSDIEVNFPHEYSELFAPPPLTLAPKLIWHPLNTCKMAVTRRSGLPS